MYISINFQLIASFVFPGYECATQLPYGCLILDMLTQFKCVLKLIALVYLIVINMANVGSKPVMKGDFICKCSVSPFYTYRYILYVSYWDIQVTPTQPLIRKQ